MPFLIVSKFCFFFVFFSHSLSGSLFHVFFELCECSYLIISPICFLVTTFHRLARASYMIFTPLKWLFDFDLCSSVFGVGFALYQLLSQIINSLILHSLCQVRDDGFRILKF